jgi:hypothetical protein
MTRIGVERTYSKRVNPVIILFNWSSPVSGVSTCSCSVTDRFFSEPIGPARVTCANPCAIEKKTATLICEASGLPPPKYLWFYGSVGKDLLCLLFIGIRQKTKTEEIESLFLFICRQTTD